ncbi:MAG: RecX family transcriptional regulator [Alistipes sp.]|nr:RecX family transcriptional regulator [Alistipes sp.]
MRDTTIDKRPERKSKTAAQALQALMRLCSRAEKSSGDAIRLMRTWDVPETERQGVLNRLIELRFIDDTRYAEAYTREKSQLAGWGAKKIALHLRQKGVDREIIKDTLSALDSCEQQERLEDKLTKKLRATKANNRYELRGKLLRYAMSLGYEYDSAKDIIDKITAEE